MQHLIRSLIDALNHPSDRTVEIGLMLFVLLGAVLCVLDMAMGAKKLAAQQEQQPEPVESET